MFNTHCVHGVHKRIGIDRGPVIILMTELIGWSRGSIGDITAGWGGVKAVEPLGDTRARAWAEIVVCRT